ncbi:DUF4190 domain-containing protein [Curtobacterium sp. NPDC098951]|uniref:DUF4190 domain-containing protein n=1 Tax=Curtobacterium sp. NPDC098951 TaxID=3363974 RepID=UPI0037F686FB
MSDQNQWPKPGETPDGGASSSPSSAAHPESGPGTSGQGASEGTAAPQNPYGAPAQPQGQPGSGAPQNPYAAPGQQNPYAAPGHQNPYAAPGQQNPYAAPGQQNPYAAPSQQNPYAAPGQQNPYAAPGQHNPYAAPGQHNPYAAPGQQNPYASAGQQNPYAYASTGYQPYAQRPKVNTLSVLAIVFGLAGALPFFWFIGILLGPTGAILGHIALGKLKTSGERGRGLALTGVIAGWVVTGIWILVVIILVATGFGSSRYSDYSGYDSGAFIG